VKLNTIRIVSLLLTIPVVLLGQELNCKVTINTESIPSAQRDYLRNFAADVERYLNSTKFTNEDLSGEKIQCNFDINVKAVSGDNSYTAQVFVGSLRPIYKGDDPTDRVTPILRINDPSWQFIYTPGQRMIHDEYSYDPLTDFLDFYAYLIIGFDLDTYVPLSGTECFKKALNTDQQASTTPQGSDWGPSSASYSRYGIVDELNSVKYTSFRNDFNNYHFDGIDLLATDPVKALNNILSTLESINNIRRLYPTSVLIKQFFGAKYMEIAEAFQTYPDRDVYDKLSSFDEEHRSTYQEWKTRQ
jgi:hypothetical protein